MSLVLGMLTLLPTGVAEPAFFAFIAFAIFDAMGLLVLVGCCWDVHVDLLPVIKRYRRKHAAHSTLGDIDRELCLRGADQNCHGGGRKQENCECVCCPL